MKQAQFSLQDERTFCRDHKPDSQEVNWLWVLEALEFSLALVGGMVLRTQTQT